MRRDKNDDLVIFREVVLSMTVYVNTLSKRKITWESRQKVYRLLHAEGGDTMQLLRDDSTLCFIISGIVRLSPNRGLWKECISLLEDRYFLDFLSWSIAEPNRRVLLENIYDLFDETLRGFHEKEELSYDW